MMYDFVINLSTGLLLGFGCYHMTVSLIHRRAPDSPRGRRSQKTALLCAAASALLAVGLGYVLQGAALYEFLLLLGLCGSIAWIDLTVRRIPNVLLAALLLCKLAFILLGQQYGDLRQGLIGLAVGLALFSLPQLLKIDIGAGDIKFAGAAGFYLGTLGLFQAMAIMFIPMVLYLAYLLITKKGNWKTFAAMGPFLSLGVVCTALFPLFQAL